MVYWKFLKKNKFPDVSDVGLTPSMCMRPLINHGQQPVKMHTEITLLFKYKYKYLVKT